MSDSNQQFKHVEFNLAKAAVSLSNAMDVLRKCIYILELEKLTMGEILDERNQLGYSIISDMATIKAVSADVDYLQGYARKQSVDEVQS
jgi:hypothetical protein